MADSPFESPFDQWAALQMMADNITSREVSLMRSAWQEAVKQERAACAKLCDQERAEFIELAGNNNGSRESDFAFGSVNFAERLAAAIRARSSMESK